MATTCTTFLLGRNQNYHDRLIDYHPQGMDYGHLSVSIRLSKNKRQVFAHVYTEADEKETRYITTNTAGRELFPPTTDFNEVNRRLEKYAKWIELHKTRTTNSIEKEYYKPLTNSNIMTTYSQTSEQKGKKVNQLLFLEYQHAKGDGHFITVLDSYDNIIARVHKLWNEETRHYEYVAYDHAGKLMSKNDKIWEIKKEFTENSKTLLEQAHQRRLAIKAERKEIVSQPEPNKSEPKVKGSPSKSVHPSQENTKATSKAQSFKSTGKDKISTRENELKDIREISDDDRGELKR